jgi:hypothetical protein
VEIKRILEVNENENTTYRTYGHSKGSSKSKDMSVHIKNTERTQKDNLKLHLKLLEKQEQAKPKTSRRRKIIKIMTEINRIDTKKTIQGINETKSWYFEKINNIEKPFANLTKMMKEKTQISKIRN